MSQSSGTQPKVSGARVPTEVTEPIDVTSTAEPAATAGASTPTPAATQGSTDRAAAQPVLPRTTRRVRLSMARLDPWSVMKVAFLLSVALGIAMVIATGVLWMVLSALNVFSDLDRIVRDVQPVTTEPFSVMDYIGLPRVISLAVVIAVINVFLLTALSTLGAYLYNICSSLVGGVRMTLTDD